MRGLRILLALCLLSPGCRTEKPAAARFSSGGGFKVYDNLDLGAPGTRQRILEREGYAAGYDPGVKQPRWVSYRLTREEVLSKAAPRVDQFRPDPDVKSEVSPEDYSGSGYDKGHMAPAADMHWSTNAMLQSFLMSNMSPQTPWTNRRIWARIEAWTRAVAVQEESVVVVSGPVMTNPAPAVIGGGAIPVPDAFFKVVYDETPPCRMTAFIVPNHGAGTNIFDCACSVLDVERATGLFFFGALPDAEHAALKASRDPETWLAK